ncbi:MAG: acetate--CoA ligase family protein [Chloroflexota bacterium]
MMETVDRPVEEQRTDIDRAMHSLFHPKSIAIIGASPNPGFANRIHANLMNGGYEGEIVPINPKYDEILGHKAYPTVDAVPGGVEHAVVVVPSRFVLPVLEQCAKAGVKSANIISSGFGEQSDEEAHQRQVQLQEFVARTGVRVVGPNCLGIISMPNKQITKSGQYDGIKPGPVGIVFQSGLLAFSMCIPTKDRDIGFSYIVTTGNEADLEAADYIRYMVEDDETRVIGCFIEQFRDPEKLIEVAELAAERGKPIVVLKVGRSARAQRAARAHTGSLVGSDAISDAVMRQYGIIRVYSLEEMTETLAVFHTDRMPEGTGVGTIFLSGGAGGLVSDLSEDIGIDLPALQPETRERLEKIIPEFGTVGNPLDVTGQAFLIPGCIEAALEALADDPNIHTVLYGQAYPSTMDLGTDVGKAFNDMYEKYPDKNFFVSSLVAGEVVVRSRIGGMGQEPIEPTIKMHGIPFLQGAENSLRAVKSLNDYAEFLRTREPIDPALRNPSPVADQAWDIVARAGGKPLVERQAKALLKLYDIPVTEEQLATDADSAVAAAREIGYPVVLKVESADITHKTDAGGVLLNLQDEEAVRSGFDRIMDSARAYDPDATIDGVLVQEMAPHGREMIVGMTQDPQFGPAIAVGLGGVFVEILKDVQLGVPPITEKAAWEMLARLKGSAILEGARGQARADIDTVVNIIAAFSRLAIDLQDLVEEIDINPLLVFDEGEGALVVDCLIIPRNSR